MGTYGMTGDVQFQFQNSFGTSQVDSLESMPFMSEGLAFTIEPLREENMYSRLAESPVHEGQHAWDGPLAFEVQPSLLGYFIKGAFGQVVTSSDAGTQTHVFEPKQSDFDEFSAVPPMSLLVNRDSPSAQNCGYLYSDGHITQFNLEIANNTLLKSTAEFVGVNFKNSAIIAPTFNATEKPWTWDVASASINGVAVCDFKTLNFTFTNNLERQYTLCGSKTARRVIRSGMQTIEVTGTVAFNSNSFQQALLDQNEWAFMLHFVGDAPHALTIDVPLARVKEWSPTMGGAGEIEAAISFSGEFSPTSNTAARITLVNTQAAY